MLINASHEVTNISDIEDVNSANYMESLAYINNLYSFINSLNRIIPAKNFKLMPTFKGIRTCQKYGLNSNGYENEMKYFRIESELFLEDNELKKRIQLEMGRICQSIVFKEKYIEFILR